jgi:beta-glucosidase
VVELYLIPPQSSIAPKIALAGFKRLRIQPLVQEEVVFHLDPRTLSQVDEKGNRAVSPGKYTVSIGSTQPDGILGSASASTYFTITGTQQLPR